jgi:hypothetical protein
MWPSMQAQREYELMKWKALSAEEQAAAWLRRQIYLWTQFLTNKWVQEHLTPTVGCPACEPPPFHIVAHRWPEYYECVCGTFVILDRWLPDGVERVTVMTYEGLEEFFKTHEKLYDLYEYPLEARLRDLRGGKSETASAESDAAI